MVAGGDFYGKEEEDEEEEEEEEEEDVGPTRAFAWPMLVQAAALAKLRGSPLALTRAGLKALGAEPATVIKAV